MKTVKKYFPLIIAAAALILYFYSEHKQSSELKANSITSVAKVYELVRIRYTYSRFKYEYFYQGVRYTSEKSLGDVNPNSIINNFYKIELSSKDPKNSRIHLDFEIKDSIKISKAGFKKNNN